MSHGYIIPFGLQSESLQGEIEYIQVLLTML